MAYVQVIVSDLRKNANKVSNFDVIAVAVFIFLASLLKSTYIRGRSHGIVDLV